MSAREDQVMDERALEPSDEDLLALYKTKYYRFGEPGWGPKQRLSFHYFNPDDVYEAVVDKLVVAHCNWADVGCGRDIFPANPDLARTLANRAGYLLGIDPDANIHDNEFISEAFQGVVEDCDTERRFDVITLRMVAEHIVNPERAVSRLARLLKPGGCAVVYTPSKWAPMSLAATVTPFWLHHPLKRLLWDAEARDTFPTAYKLNTRKDLQSYFLRYEMREVFFRHLDDCRVFGRYKLLNWLELALRDVLHRIGLRHPETCLLGVYQKAGAPAGDTQ